jgi:hypothetical protein
MYSCEWEMQVDIGFVKPYMLIYEEIGTCIVLARNWYMRWSLEFNVY